MRNKKLFTIGYQGLNQDLFVECLLTHGIQIVLDVRAIPNSRKKGFSKRSLENCLNNLGLKYEHVSSLGTPYQIRKQFKADGNFDSFEEQFKEILAHEDALLDSLSEQVKNSVYCLLCFEKLPSECHRSIVAKELAKRAAPSLEICHL